MASPPLERMEDEMTELEIERHTLMQELESLLDLAELHNTILKSRLELMRRLQRGVQDAEFALDVQKNAELSEKWILKDEDESK